MATALALASALSCLQLSSPSLSLAPYQPALAEAHFTSLRAALRPWTNGSIPMHRAAGFSGPWIENVWVESFSKA